MKKLSKLIDLLFPIIMYVLTLLLFLNDYISTFEFVIIILAVFTFMVINDIKSTLANIYSAICLIILRDKHDE